MNRFPTERLMTIEEAKRLSVYGEDESPQVRQQKARSIWSWQTVEGMLSQQVSDEQVDQVLRARKD